MHIIGFIIVGAIIGALARLALPGRQSISTLVTVILGILGSLIAGWIMQALAYKNASFGVPWLAYLASIVVAALLIVAYGAVTGKKQV